MIEADRELIRIGHHRGRAGVRVHPVRAGRKIGQGVAREHTRDARIDRHRQHVARKCRGIQAGALLGCGDWKHLGRPQHLAKSLVLAEVERLAFAVIDVRQHDRTAVGKSEFVAAERRKPARAGNGGVIKVISGVEGRIAHEFKKRTVEAAAPRSGDDVGKAGGAAADFRRHPSRLRLNLLHGIDVEVTEGRSTHLRVADVSAIHGKGRFDASLAVDGKLLGEVGGSVGIRHGARRQQQQLAEVALVEWELADRLARELYPACGLLGGG